MLASTSVQCETETNSTRRPTRYSKEKHLYPTVKLRDSSAGVCSRPWSIRGSRTQSSSLPCHASRNHQSMGTASTFDDLCRYPSRNNISTVRRDAVPLPFFSYHHTSIFLLPNVPLHTAPTCTCTKQVPHYSLTRRL